MGGFEIFPRVTSDILKVRGSGVHVQFRLM